MKQVFFIASLFFTTISFATIIHVPNDYPTIQLAVNNSTQGDTIIVGDGVYTENIQVNIGVNILSENGPENCSFFYSDNVCGFTLYSGALISGFWFKGKGRINFNGSGTVRNSIFTDIYENNCNPYFISVTTTNDINIINCQFRNNYSSCTSYVDDGRGLIIIPTGYAPSVNIDSCIFINNTFNYSTGQGSNGGAIYIGSPNSTTFISNSQFISNKIVRWGMPKGQGGAIYSNTNNISILNCYFYDNLAEAGSAVYIGWYNNSFSLINSTFENNLNIAIYNMASTNSTVRNCNFTNNMNGIYNDRDNLFFDADSNWWGSSSGPYHPTYNTNGLGDSVNIYVDVIPFHTEPDTVAPIPLIQNVSVDTFGIDYVDIIWDASPIGDLAGYKVYFDNTAIDVGLDTAYTLSGLTLGEEYSVSVFCYDNGGEESWYSEELLVTPNPVSIITAVDSVDFGVVLIGDNTQMSLLISNNGTTDLNITNITSSVTEFEPEIDNLLVSPSSQGVIPIIFTPTEFGFFTANLAITSNAYNTPDLVITLIGSGDLAPSPTMLSVVDVPDDQGGSGAC